MSRPLTVVVGTGRCGSTLLSRLLRSHPDVLGLSEFFGTLRLLGGGGPGRVPTGQVDGAGLWALLTRPFPMLDAMITDGLRTGEMAYPYRTGRFRPETGVPMICHYVLPLLSDDPDALFDELAGIVPSWPRRAAAEHYRALFDLLAARAGASVVLERSASSLALVDLLHALFPDARVVHLYRDGPDCALSMSRHPAFRRDVLATLARRAVDLPPDASLQQVDAALPPRLRGLICPPYDARRLMAHPIGPAVFARLRWTPMIRAGAAALGRLPAGSWTAVRYEDLLRDPRATLTRIVRFAGTDAPGPWLDACAAEVDPTRTGAAELLDPDVRSRLAFACAPGVRALAGTHPSG